MGLHQKIIDGVTAEPCDCGADDDHAASLMDDFHAIQEILEKANQKVEVEDPADPEDVWTDGSE